MNHPYSPWTSAEALLACREYQLENGWAIGFGQPAPLNNCLAAWGQLGDALLPATVADQLHSSVVFTRTHTTRNLQLDAVYVYRETFIDSVSNALMTLICATAGTANQTDLAHLEECLQTLPSHRDQLMFHLSNHV